MYHDPFTYREGESMAVASYITKDDLDKAMKDMEDRLEAMFKKYSREQANRVIEAMQRGTSASF